MVAQFRFGGWRWLNQSTHSSVANSPRCSPRRLGQAGAIYSRRSRRATWSPQRSPRRIALDGFGLPTGETLALEDSLNGILAARAAGAPA